MTAKGGSLFFDVKFFRFAQWYRNMGHFQRLEDLRIDHNLTQEEVAGLLHCQREVYRRYEKGIRKIPVDCVVTLARYYRCSSDYILGLTNQIEPYVDSGT